ncbi:uncharacterized protein BBA_08667 [Beauveria bassiana ARSEF 2860]|uniref:Uncharacterized protein n=1 Tax=Beauveria bassiana (strain ARSEF 2860) TaxID=655819 RepID=J5JFD4_BEAB2|nr:uncharacterized protein BBA_08667 [Beauveria bassiana ARSEF 2860]EJP62341.1 hypothetical protein BBA_08667 [Beauveria bassiana ARSEF 2860]
MPRKKKLSLNLYLLVYIRVKVYKDTSLVYKDISLILVYNIFIRANKYSYLL